MSSLPPGIVPNDASNAPETIIIILLVIVNCFVSAAGAFLHLRHRYQGNVTARLPSLLTLNNAFIVAFSILAVVSCRHEVNRKVAEVGLLTLMTMIVFVQLIRATRLVFLNEFRHRMSKDSHDDEAQLEHTFFSHDSYDDDDDSYNDNHYDDDYWYDEDEDDEWSEDETDDRSFNASYNNWQQLLDEFSDLESEDDHSSEEETDSAQFSKNRRRGRSGSFLSRDNPAGGRPVPGLAGAKITSRVAQQDDIRLSLHHQINIWFVQNKYVSTVFYLVGFTIFMLFKFGLLITVFISVITPSSAYVLWYAMLIISLIWALTVLAVIKYIRIRQYQMYLERLREYRDKYEAREEYYDDDDDDDDDLDHDVDDDMNTYTRDRLDSKHGSKDTRTPPDAQNESSSIHSSGGKSSMKQPRTAHGKHPRTGDKSSAFLQAADKDGEINMFGVTLGVVRDRGGTSVNSKESSTISTSNRFRDKVSTTNRMGGKSRTAHQTPSAGGSAASGSGGAGAMHYDQLRRNNGFPTDLYNKMNHETGAIIVPNPPMEPQLSIFSRTGDTSGFLIEMLITAFISIIFYTIALITIVIGHGMYNDDPLGDFVVTPSRYSDTFTRVMILFIILGHIAIAYYSTVHIFTRNYIEDLWCRITGRPSRIPLAVSQFDELDSLKKILADPGAREEFRLFLESEFSAENLLFWNAVEEFRVKLPYHFDKRSESIASAKYIFSTYLAQGGVYEVNISAQCREKITLKLKKLTEDDPLKDCRQQEIWEISEALRAHYDKGTLYHFYDKINGERYVADFEAETNQPRSAKIIAKISSEPVASVMTKPISPFTLERFTYYQIIEIFTEISNVINTSPKQQLGHSLSNQSHHHAPVLQGPQQQRRNSRMGRFNEDDDRGQRFVDDDSSDSENDNGGGVAPPPPPPARASAAPYPPPPSFPVVLPNIIEHQYLVNAARRIDSVLDAYNNKRGPLANPPDYRRRRAKKRDRGDNPDNVHQLNKNTLMCFDWKVAAARRRLVAWTDNAEEMSLVFDTAQTEVFKLMERDSYARFAKSSPWKQYVLQRAQEQGPNTRRVA